MGRPQAAFLDNQSLRLPAGLRLVVEVSQLQSCAPPLVARAALLWVEDKDGYQWRCLAAEWVKSR